ncbi:MAG: PhoU domain-containing protein, partial [Candidatus Latescibacteria bacterium]|nr:PhoU domain-containing protein [Candidatus Latescibacterota bacterium]
KELVDLMRSEDMLLQAWDASHTMLEVDQEMMLEAVRILRESDDAEINREIRKKDKLVNQYERDVRRMVMTHCSLRGASELPSGMALISIVMDIERIGDLTKNIVDLAVIHPSRLVIPECDEQLKLIEETIKSRFAATIETLQTQDEEQANLLVSTHKEEVTRVASAILDKIIIGDIKSLSAPDAAVAALYLAYMKRIGAHLKNVATSVVHPIEWIGYRRVKTDKA